VVEPTRLTDEEIRQIEMGLSDTDVHTVPLDLLAAVESILSARVRDAKATALREAADALIKNGPVLNWELNYDGTEDNTRAAYVEAFRDAHTFIAARADAVGASDEGNQT
jgi:hypothetical protein